MSGYVRFLDAEELVAMHLQDEDDRKPKCCCANGGDPWLCNGEMVVSRNSGCRVHQATIRFVEQPQQNGRRATSSVAARRQK